MMKRIATFIIILLVFSCGCGAKKIPVKESINISPPDSANGEITQRAVTDKKDHPSFEELLGFPSYVDYRLMMFAFNGIESFYRLHKHVPSSLSEYYNSGFPLLIPVDYITGKTYHPVDTIDLNDSTGFTFWSDGIDSCRFDFVVYNENKGKKEIRTWECKDKETWVDYKVVDGKPGLLMVNDYYFDWVKMEDCMEFFYYYGLIHMEKNKKAPENLAEMFKSEGTLIEAGWKWSPKENGELNFFEFGWDLEKNRFYHITGCSIGCKKNIMIYQAFDNEEQNDKRIENVNAWELSMDQDIPTDIITLNKFISSDSFYDGYLEITGK